MRAITGTREEIEQLAAAVDRARGLPRQYREDEIARVGPGPHVPIELLRIDTHARPIRHPARDEWAYPVTDAVRELSGREVDVPGRGRVRIDTAGERELEQTWREVEPTGEVVRAPR